MHAFCRNHEKKSETLNYFTEYIILKTVNNNSYRKFLCVLNADFVGKLKYFESYINRWHCILFVMTFLAPALSGIFNIY
jgi:hypothetical protein